MKKNIPLGILFKIFNIWFFIIISIISGEISKSIHAIQITCSVFFICSIALFLICLVCRYDMGIKSYTSLVYYVIRGLCNTFGIYFWIEAIRYIGPNEATAISYMTPIFTFILATLIHEERPKLYSTCAIVLSFVGVVYIIQPSTGQLVSYGGSVAMLSALIWAIHDIICKKQASSEHHVTQAMYTFICSFAISLPIAVKYFAPVTDHDWIMMSMMAVPSAINVIVLFCAYGMAPITSLMPFSYLKFVFMALATYLLYGTMPNKDTIIGVLIISISSIILFALSKRAHKINKMN